MDTKEVKYELIKAEDQFAKYSNPMVRLFMALGFLGVFASLVSEYMVVMSALSQNDHHVDYNTAAGALIVFTVCLAAVIVLGKKDKHDRKKFIKEQKQIRKNAVKYKGKIVKVQKLIRHVKYMNDVFDEITWRFIVKFKNENNEVVTTYSDYFLNDISKVLKSSYVSVYVLTDGSCEISGFKLRESEEDAPIILKIETTEEELQ